MSSQSKAHQLEAALLIISMLIMTIWYAWPQIFYSLFIVYDVGLLLAPSLTERILSIIGGML